MKGTNNEQNLNQPSVKNHRIRIAVATTLIVAATLFAAWMMSRHLPIYSNKAVTVNSSQSESTAQSKTVKVTQKESTPTAKQSQTAPQPTAEPASAKTVSHKIEEKDGITYVDGILIANKTYSLPENYSPGLLPETQEAFNKMQQAAAMEGINLWICSGFRSYSTQQQLYNSYVARDGKQAADTYSARAGHSEHQTGLAIDVNEPSNAFDGTPEAQWLAAHCTDYGFIIRYKPGKESSTGYMAESWHIRYLGDTDLCKKIEASGQSLEEYLGISSVYAQ